MIKQSFTVFLFIEPAGDIFKRAGSFCQELLGFASQN
jgi:hypothetical protein